MMTFLKGAFSILFGLSFCLPLTLKLFLPGDRSIIQILTTTFGLSIGFLTLVMAYLSTFCRPFFNLYGIIIPVGIFFLFFFIWIVRDGKSFQLSENEVVDFLSSSPMGFLWRAPILLICVLVFWGSIYYPFVTEDAITTYASAAKNIYLSGGMEGFRVPHFSPHFDTYPLLVPLSYVYNYFAFGEINEHAAKVIPGLFSIGLLGSTYALGKRLFGNKIGLFSALSLSFSPFFLRWSTSGYADIPVAFFYTNSMLYCWLTFRHPSLKYAILAGLMVGFSIWTKNGALLMFISVLLFFLVQRFMKRSAFLGSEVGSFHLRHLMIILLVSSAIGGPWYLRNHLLYQYLVPTGWVSKGWWSSYGIPFYKYFATMGYHFPVLYVFGMIYGSYRLFQKDIKVLFLFSFIFPYLIVWLLKFNYDTRFLFMILPPFVILGVWSIVECFKKVLDELVRKEVIALVMGGFLVFPHLGYAIAKNRDLFSGPSLSDDEKRLGKMRRFYPLVLYFKDLQSKGEKNIRIVTGESRLIYFLNYDMVTYGYPTKTAELRDFDYFVYTHFTVNHYREMGALEGNEVLDNLFNERYFVKVFESGGNIVYKIVH